MSHPLCCQRAPQNIDGVFVAGDIPIVHWYLQGCFNHTDIVPEMLDHDKHFSYPNVPERVILRYYGCSLQPSPRIKNDSLWATVCLEWEITPCSCRIYHSIYCTNMLCYRGKIRNGLCITDMIALLFHNEKVDVTNGHLYPSLHIK